MAKPQILQRLRHGRLLCGSVFKLFVETWNWLIGSFDNLRGDWDVNNGIGHISIDKTDPDHQVIRLVRLPKGADPDDRSVNFNDQSKLQVYGWKTQEGGGSSVATMLDGGADGVEIVARSGGVNGSLVYVPVGTFAQSTATPVTLDFVGDIMYDISDHQLKKRVDNVNLRTGVVTQGVWEMITDGQAVALSTEV